MYFYVYFTSYIYAVPQSSKSAKWRQNSTAKKDGYQINTFNNFLSRPASAIYMHGIYAWPFSSKQAHIRVLLQATIIYLHYLLAVNIGEF